MTDHRLIALEIIWQSLFLAEFLIGYFSGGGGWGGGGLWSNFRWKREWVSGRRPSSVAIRAIFVTLLDSWEWKRTPTDDVTERELLLIWRRLGRYGTYGTYYLEPTHSTTVTCPKDGLEPYHAWLRIRDSHQHCCQRFHISYTIYLPTYLPTYLNS